MSGGSPISKNIDQIRTGDGEFLTMPPAKAEYPYQTPVTEEVDQTRLQYIDQFVTKKSTVAGYDRIIPSGFQSIHHRKYTIEENSWLIAEEDAELIVL